MNFWWICELFSTELIEIYCICFFPQFYQLVCVRNKKLKYVLLTKFRNETKRLYVYRMIIEFVRAFFFWKQCVFLGQIKIVKWVWNEQGKLKVNSIEWKCGSNLRVRFWCKRIAKAQNRLLELFGNRKYIVLSFCKTALDIFRGLDPSFLNLSQMFCSKFI